MSNHDVDDVTPEPRDTVGLRLVIVMGALTALSAIVLSAGIGLGIRSAVAEPDVDSQSQSDDAAVSPSASSSPSASTDPSASSSSGSRSDSAAAGAESEAGDKTETETGTASKSDASTQTAEPAAPTKHLIAYGETLSEISGRTGVPIDELIALNGITDPNLIYEGATLLVPADTVTD